MAEGPGRVQEGSDPSQCDSACRMVQLRAVMIVDRRARLLLVTLGFLRLEGQLRQRHFVQLSEQALWQQLTP